uniref:Peptidase A3A domain-containing protein n=2 Tax=Cacopsylla melanoneura TaxID=428564 RepID=A0A8D9B085_9HEMI
MIDKITILKPNTLNELLDHVKAIQNADEIKKQRAMKTQPTKQDENTNSHKSNVQNKNNFQVGRFRQYVPTRFQTNDNYNRNRYQPRNNFKPYQPRNNFQPRNSFQPFNSPQNNFHNGNGYQPSPEKNTQNMRAQFQSKNSHQGEQVSPRIFQNNPVGCHICNKKNHETKDCFKRNQDSVQFDSRKMIQHQSHLSYQWHDKGLDPQDDECIFTSSVLKNRRLHTLIDTGAGLTVVEKQFVDSNRIEPFLLKLTAANGTDIQCIGVVSDLEIVINNHTFMIDVLAVEHLSGINLVLGRDFLKHYKAKIDFELNETFVKINNKIISLSSTVEKSRATPKLTVDSQNTQNKKHFQKNKKKNRRNRTKKKGGINNDKPITIKEQVYLSGMSGLRPGDGV